MKINKELLDELTNPLVVFLLDQLIKLTNPITSCLFPSNCKHHVVSDLVQSLADIPNVAFEKGTKLVDDIETKDFKFNDLGKELVIVELRLVILVLD